MRARIIACLEVLNTYFVYSYTTKIFKKLAKSVAAIIFFIFLPHCTPLLFLTGNLYLQKIGITFKTIEIYAVLSLLEKIQPHFSITMMEKERISVVHIKQPSCQLKLNWVTKTDQVGTLIFFHLSAIQSHCTIRCIYIL